MYGLPVERIPDCTGVLVAGGRARRMGGTPKGLLRVGATSIAERSVGLFRALFGRVLVVALDPGPWEGLGVTVIPDRIPERGAPGGLHAGLSATEDGWVFAAACDMPFLAEGPIRALAARRTGASAVLPEGAHGPEGLHAFWNRSTLPVLERLLQNGNPSLRALAGAVGATIVPADEWRRIDPGGRSLENVNAPEDLARLGLEAPGRTA